MSHYFLANLPKDDIIKYLSLPVEEPTLRYLNRLIHAYTRKVPWESVSRIVKRLAMKTTLDCPRWPEEFWHDALLYGLGGTCFESSLAFFSLLTSLGYEGYLTVNDMGTTQACHAAIVILRNGRKYLVDITIPVHGAVEISPHKATRKHTDFHDYVVFPIGADRYQVERSHHPQRYAFTLIDRPVNLLEYQAIVESDYTEAGFFLRSVVMVKVIDNKVWRFFSDHKPYKLESFNRNGRADMLLSPKTLAQSLAQQFQMPKDKILAALSWTRNLVITHYDK
jgi:arylamine N-acetyltransferase